jgi:hypothetical protein
VHDLEQSTCDHEILEEVDHRVLIREIVVEKHRRH